MVVKKKKKIFFFFPPPGSCPRLLLQASPLCRVADFYFADLKPICSTNVTPAISLVHVALLTTPPPSPICTLRRVYSGCGDGAAMVTSLGASTVAAVVFFVGDTARNHVPISVFVDVSRARTSPSVSPFMPDSGTAALPQPLCSAKKLIQDFSGGGGTMTPFFVQIPQTFTGTRRCGSVLLPDVFSRCEHIVPDFARKAAPSTQLISQPTLTSFIFIDFCFSIASPVP